MHPQRISRKGVNASLSLEKCMMNSQPIQNNLHAGFLQHLLRLPAVQWILIIRKTNIAAVCLLIYKAIGSFCKLLKQFTSVNWSCPKSIEVIFFNKSANDFFMDFYRARKADCFTGESFDTRSECQVITLNALGVDLAH